MSAESTVMQCGRCKRLMPASMFYKNPKTASGYASRCKDCVYDMRYVRVNGGKTWTQKDREKLISIFPHKTYREMTRVLKRSINSVKQMANKLGLRKNNPPVKTKTEHIEKALELHWHGMSVRKIAKELGISVPTVAKHLKDNGCLLSTKWTERDDTILREMCAEGHDITSISTMLCRTEGAVYARIGDLNIRTMYWWTEEQKEFLINNFMTMPYEEIGRHVGRTIVGVRNMCVKLGLIRFDRWTDEEVKLLREYYPHKDRSFLVNLLGRNAKSIHTKAERLGIGKTDEYMARLAEKRNNSRREKCAERRTAKQNAVVVKERKRKTTKQNKQTFMVNPFDVNRTVPMNYVEGCA